MIDHITIEVGDLEKSKLFYERAFAPLNYRLSFGKEGVFWAFDVGDGCLFEIQRTGEAPPLTHLHVAFRVGSKAEVDAFHGQRWRPEPKTMGRPACVRTMPRIITPASCSTPTATTSRR